MLKQPLQGTASRQGCVPGLPFARVMQEWVAKEEIDLARRLNIGVEDLRSAQKHAAWSPMVRLAELLGMDIHNARKIKNGKREWIGRHGEFRYLSIETSEVGVRRYGDTAIVRCVQRSRASWRGEPMALAVRLSQVWISQPAGWQIVAIQFSTLGSG